MAILVALVMSAATLSGTLAMLTVGAEPTVNLAAAEQGSHRRG
jgi:hypothetical protein